MPRSSKAMLHERRIRLDADRLPTLASWLIVGLFVGAMVALIRLGTGSWIDTAMCLGILGAIGGVISVRAVRRKEALANGRGGESICSFARSFDRHSTDPVVLRAVYETIQAQMGPPAVPIRAADRFLEDLGLDDEDLDEIYGEAALLACRPTDDAERNPMWSHVRTVGDLVAFLHHQPRVD